MNALATNWRQKARSSAKGFASPAPTCAGAERDAEPIVAMTRALVFKTPFSALKTSFRLILLKDSFNCRDLGGHGDDPVFIRGERMENAPPRLPFGGRAATSAAANFRKIQRFQGSRWLANSSISCRV
ncbi:hypothetical protein [Bradyrhizobium sp. AZCC 1721]|uniref:hypothetical protein n=1 Tax=Bradyrhizobium sp. AZCC 1721 TaxID=3117016 RepID=UPI002FF17592